MTSPPSASTAGSTAGGTGAGIVDVTVTTPGGTSHHSAADHYAYTASKPAVTGVSPPSGSTAGGSTVTITGTGLAGATAVRFGAAAATITADSGTQITVTSPPGTGRVDITVTTPAGTTQTSQGPYYSYSAQPEPAQSITFAVPAPAGAGGSAALSAAGGGSGNPVVFTVDPASGPGVCTISGTTVTYAAIGTCVIDANQAGNGHYAAAPQVQRTITVSGLTQAISLTAPGQGYVHDTGHVSATGGGSGNPVVLTGGGTCTLSGTTVTYTAAGQLRHHRQPGRQRALRGRRPGPAHDHGQEEAPGDRLLRSGVGGPVVIGAAVGHRRRLGQPRRAYLRHPRDLPRLRGHGDLYRDRHLRDRRQPGRQRHLRRRTPGPALYQGHPDTPVPRSFLFFVGFCGVTRPGCGQG